MAAFPAKTDGFAMERESPWVMRSDRQTAITGYDNVGWILCGHIGIAHVARANAQS
jgi:hypothetical protein